MKTKNAKSVLISTVCSVIIALLAVPVITLSASQKEAPNIQASSQTSLTPEEAANRALEAYKLRAARGSANVSLSIEAPRPARATIPAAPSGIGPVLVNATGGASGTQYGTLGAAFAAINAGIHQGDITVNILGSTVEGATPATLNGSGAGAASYTSVLIRASVDNAMISGNPANGFGVVQLNGASNVTIDGDNPNTGGTNRNLTIQNTAASTATFSSCVRIALATSGNNHADNDVIKNLNILGSATGRNVSSATSTSGSEYTTYGILAGGGGSTTAGNAPSAIASVTTTIGSGATATNLIIQNNSVTTAARAIAVQGSATTVFTNLLVENNLIGNPTAGAADQVYCTGITVQGSGTTAGTTGTVRGNLVYVEGYLASSTRAPRQASRPEL